MSHLCPTCQRILYNRRLAKCGFCSATIPEELRFTAAEAAVLEQRAAELEKSFFERAKARQEEEEEQRRKAQHLSAVIPFFFVM